MVVGQILYAKPVGYWRRCMKWMVIFILMIAGCSSEVEDSIDSVCFRYYGNRIGVNYARDICK